MATTERNVNFGKRRRRGRRAPFLPSLVKWDSLEKNSKSCHFTKAFHMVFSNSAIHFRRNVLYSRCISISRKEGLILLRLKYGNSALLYVRRRGREAKLTNETFLILPLTAGRKRRRGGEGPP